MSRRARQGLGVAVICGVVALAIVTSTNAVIWTGVANLIGLVGMLALVFVGWALIRD